MVYRIYVEKKPDYAVEAAALLEELSSTLGVSGIRSLRVLNRYDVQGIEEELFERCVPIVFSEPPVDEVFRVLPAAEHVFGVEFLPGQFDQRADSAAECIQLVSRRQRPLVQTARVYLIEGDLSAEQIESIQKYIVNPVECRLADLQPRQSLTLECTPPEDIPVLPGFTALQPPDYAGFITQYGLAMDPGDLGVCVGYFTGLHRQPTLTELRVIDTYWSDHCRHTTFGTVLDSLTILDGPANRAYQMYQDLRREVYGEAAKPVTLMDMATIGAKALRARGRLPFLDESEEVNACSIHIEVDNGGKNEPWLLLFKNETHNHPTEIEPFGGAATCIGGAIRDPLANRGYVFGAMRVTGAGDPLAPVSQTLPGKLPQRKLVQTAAKGYSSYGNQIGLATGLVQEIYHPGYVAKRMEVGAVLGAVPLENVRRETPRPGDVVLLLGGKTGRDGCGGATGSSKAHKVESLASCGAEVQKGNAPVERKLQRLFRNPEASRLISRCNDFGAGGVSVAIGELADGLRIDLDAIPKKYEGLDGTELAISESQERMAVVVRPEDAERMIRLAGEENLDATQVATVTREARLEMVWRGQVIVDLDRSFLASNGAQKHASVLIEEPPSPAIPQKPASMREGLLEQMGALRFCGQRGLAGMFDSTIGAGSVLMPFGGKYQASPTQAMVLKLPVEGETDSCAGMAFGFDPWLSEQNPYEGARCAVFDSVAKLAACGFSTERMALSFQEYFERLGDDARRWGKPVATLLGALDAQMALGIAAIGGKDSMSGSYEQMDVPPTLISFAVAPGRAGAVVSAHFEAPFSRVVLLRPAAYRGAVPEAEAFKAVLAQLSALHESKNVLSARSLGAGGVAEGLFLMGLGNRMGLRFDAAFDTKTLFEPAHGSFLVELADEADAGLIVGETTTKFNWLAAGERVELEEIRRVYEDKLEPVLPYQTPSFKEAPLTLESDAKPPAYTGPAIGAAMPRALVPVFPGTNCEYDTVRALRRAGARPEIFVINNRTPAHVAESAAALAQKLRQCQMLVLPGGFSGGDEPEGSAKLIAAFFRGPDVSEAVAALLEKRDGLVLGICNGFQALIKLGLLPYGKITTPAADAPTLTFNAIGRHQSMLVRTRVASQLSPWLMHEPVGTLHTIAVSHGEGRFVASNAQLAQLAASGQIAAQYVDFENQASLAIAHNPAGSQYAVEALSSPDGRVLGKMGHSERSGAHLYKNISGNKFQKLFEGGVDYFK